MAASPPRPRTRIALLYPGEARRVRVLRRPNRFLAIVRDPELGLLEAHVPNPGRLIELLPAGGTVGHIVPAPRPATAGSSPSSASRERPRVRRTSWTLVSVRSPEDPEVWVSVDTGAARPLVDQALERKALPPLDRWGPWRSEVVWGRHRFDHAVMDAKDPSRPRALLEVKSSNLREGLTGLFPDAPTVRGTGHVEALTRFVRNGEGPAALLFLVQRDDVREVRPYGAMDPKFAHAVEEARAAGVLLLGRALHVLPEGALWSSALPVRGPRWEMAGDLDRSGGALPGRSRTAHRRRRVEGRRS